MRRKQKAPAGENASLVPLADMLSNVVGIMLFILAFTVLSSGGAVIEKSLPMEHKSDEKPIYFVCWNQRVLPLDSDLSDKIVDPLGKPTYETLDTWIKRFNSARAEDEFFTVTGKGDVQYLPGLLQKQAQLNLVARYDPKPGKGESKDELRRANSRFASILKTNQKAKKYAYFIVYPDCIDIFKEARLIAAEDYGIGAGWGPIEAGKPVQFNLAGNAGTRPDKQ